MCVGDCCWFERLGRLGRAARLSSGADDWLLLLSWGRSVETVLRVGDRCWFGDASGFEPRDSAAGMIPVAVVADDCGRRLAVTESASEPEMSRNGCAVGGLQSRCCCVKQQKQTGAAPGVLLETGLGDSGQGRRRRACACAGAGGWDGGRSQSRSDAGAGAGAVQEPEVTAVPFGCWGR